MVSRKLPPTKQNPDAGSVGESQSDMAASGIEPSPDFAVDPDDVQSLDNSEDDDGETVGEYTDDEVIKSILECRRESYDARRHRMRQNHMNRDAYMSIQDWSHKQRGQSTEFLPKTASAVEQFSAFIKKSLVGFGDWFSVTMSEDIKPYVTDAQVRNLMKYFLGRLPQGDNKFTDIESVIGDGAKVGLLESLTVFKVYARRIGEPDFHVEPGGAKIFDFTTGIPRPSEAKLTRKMKQKWHLGIDLIRSEDYFPDPTGRGLYEIHEVERDVVDIEPLVKAGIYDKDAFESAKMEDVPKPEFERRRPQQLGQDRSVPPAFRRRIVVTEYWGTLLGEGGRVIARNCVSALFNRKYLARAPEINPYWHGESCFVAHPLIRVPFSALHKALYDAGVYINYAINEMFNLMLDGGIADVWGIKQLRIDQLADVKQIEGGIGQGVTLHVKDSLPPNAKVLEKVTEGSIPQDAMAIFQMLDEEFTASVLTNELRLGQLPSVPTKATAIVTAEQNQSMTLSSVTMYMERGEMEPLLRKSYLIIIQHLDEIEDEELIPLIGTKATALLRTLSTPERFVRLAKAVNFNVSGLTATLAASQDFQKLMAFLQAASQNPLLMHALMSKYSPDRILKVMMKLLNLNPDDFVNTDEEQKMVPQVLAQMAMFAQLFGGGQQQGGQGTQDGTGGTGIGPGTPTPPGSLATPPGQDPAMTAGVNQKLQPLTGLRTT